MEQSQDRTQPNGLAFEDTSRDMRGAVHLEVRKAGEVVLDETEHNLIAVEGRSKLAQMLGGAYGGHITKIGVGTGSTPAADGDTKLTGAVLLNIKSVTYDGTKVRFNFTIGSGEANGVNIREFGLFFADNTMFSHRVRKSVIGKENDIEITGYWDIFM